MENNNYSVWKKSIFINKTLNISNVFVIYLALLVIPSCSDMGLTDSYMKKSVNDYTEQYIENFLTELDSFSIKDINIIENKPLQIAKGIKVPNSRDVMFEIKIQFYWSNNDLTKYSEMIHHEIEIGLLDSIQGQIYERRLNKPKELTIKRSFLFEKPIKPGNKPEDWEMIGRYCKWEFLVKHFKYF